MWNSLDDWINMGHIWREQLNLVAPHALTTFEANLLQNLNANLPPDDRPDRTFPVRLFGEYSLGEIKAMPALSETWDAELLVDTGGHRLWRSKATVADGAEWDNGVVIEELRDGRWTTVREYEAK